MVHHGYKRPGWGHIVGDCMGVHEMPYEQSCDVCKRYLAAIQVQKANLESYKVSLVAGNVVEVTFNSYGGLVTVTKDSVQCEWEWRHALERKIRDVDLNIEGLRDEITRMDKRVSSWKLAPIKNFEERLEGLEAAKAERQSVMAAKRAERQAAAQAKAERKAALEARRAAETAKLFAFIRELAAKSVPLSSKDQDKVRRAVKKATWLWDRDYAPVTAELQKLGLMDDRGFFTWA